MFEADELAVCDRVAWRVPATGTPMTCLDYDVDGNYVAYSNEPGEFHVLKASDGTEICHFTQELTEAPITGLRFHRSSPGIILATSKDGYIFMHDFGKNERVLATRQLGNNLLVMNVDPFGDQFAIGCADGTIRIHDAENFRRTKACVKSSQRISGGQSVSLYCLTFHPEDANILLAAGYNDRVYFWDIRSGQAERCIAGPHVRGEAVDMIGNLIVTASARDKKQVEVWDFGSTKRVAELAFDNNRFPGKGVCLPNTLKLSRNEEALIVGGTGVPGGELFNFRKGMCIGQSQILSTSVICSSISPYASSFVVGSENGDAVCQMVRAKPGTII